MNLLGAPGSLLPVRCLRNRFRGPFTLNNPSDVPL